MRQIKYCVKTISPILLSANTGDQNMSATMDYIPGSVVLGVFAQKLIASKNLRDTAHEDPDFYNWFLNSKIIFTNAYPYQMLENGIRNYLPAPLSIQTEKNSESSAFDLLKRESKEQMKTIAGYCHIAGDVIIKHTPSKSINFHHARPDRIKGHSAEGLIFNYESVDPDQLFEGAIIGEEDTLKKFLSVLGGGEIQIRIGRSKTAQYGKAEFELLSDKAEEISIEDDAEDEFILTFLSPTILYNKNVFSSTSLNDLKRYLSDALQVGSEKIEILKAFKKPVEIENFIAAWRHKRPSDVAFQPGSCFLIKINSWDENIKNSLLQLQKNGIGERRGEGFGRIKLNYQKGTEYAVGSSKGIKIKKPDGDMPISTEDIFKKVIKNHSRKIIEREALREYLEFSRNTPTNSLLGRLEMMIKNSSNKEGFLGQFAELRDTARDKLKACRGENTTLFDFIRKGEPDLQQVIRQESEITRMGEQVGYSFIADSAFHEELYKSYWLIFFRMLRKSNNKERGE